MNSEYSNYWKDPRWQRFRLKVLEKDGFKCTNCGDAKSELHAHHLYYISKRKPWEYPEECVLTLCDDCHKVTHEVPSEILEWEISLGVFTRAYHGNTIGFAIGPMAYHLSADSIEELSDAVSWSICNREDLLKKILSSYRKSKLWKKSKPNKGGTLE